MTINSYRDLQVWQKGMVLAKECYFLTREFPREEMYGMTLQIRRAAASVPANIAEGYGRESTGDYIRFLRVSQGSLKELETHHLLSAEVELTSQTKPSLSDKSPTKYAESFRALVRSLQSKQV